MSVDPRITRAKRALRQGLAEGVAAKLNAPSRSTGLRQEFKHGHNAAQEALDILSESPRKGRRTRS